MVPLKIAFVGQQEYFRCHYGDDLDDLYEVFKKHLVHGAADGYYDDLIAFNPDITIVFRGELLPGAVVDRLKGRKISISTEPLPKIIGGRFRYTEDSLSRFKTFLETFQRRYDHVFHYDESSKEFLANQGVEPSGYVALPIALGTYHPAPIPRERDIMFLGRSSPHRERFFGALKRDFDFLHLAHGLPSLLKEPSIEKDLLPYVSAFKISLNVHAEDELSWEPRMQMMLACGALVISEPISTNSFLEPGRHFLEVRTPEELYLTCRDVVRNSERFDEMRHLGHERVRQTLAARKNWPALFDSILGGQHKAATLQPYRLRLDTLEICRQHSGLDHLLQALLDDHG